MRYFLSTGEASAELSASLLAGAIAKLDPEARFEGIGGARMAAAGIALWHSTRGWGSMGPLQALSRIPKLLTIALSLVARLRRSTFDVLVFVDFGAFHLRLARWLRQAGFQKPIVYFFPPGAWLDRASQAQAVARLTCPLVAFAHQRDFYASLGLAVHYFGHPLRDAYTARAPLVQAPPGGGHVAILPGSRLSELRYHLPRLLDALQLLRSSRPELQATIGAADDAAMRMIRHEVDKRDLRKITLTNGSADALTAADAAWIASGTAVLEAALLGVPTVALYVLSPAQAQIARRVYSGKHITLPNILMQREIIPELLQDAATPRNLAHAMQELLENPHTQVAALSDFREHLGPENALLECARYVVEVAAKQSC